MQRSLFFLTVFTGLVIFTLSCKQNQQKAEAVPPSSGNTYSGTSAPLSAEPTETVIGDVRIVNYTNTGGRRPKDGEVAIVFIENWVADSMLISSRKKMGGPMSVPMKEVKNAPENPLVYAMMHMGIGDSVSVYRPIDAGIMSILPPRLQKEKLMRANLVLVDIKTVQEASAPIKK